jgi:hypothetical protein
MKPKHDGLLTVVVAAAAVLAAAVLGVLNHPGYMGQLLSSAVKPLPQVRMPDAASLERMGQLERRIERLRQPSNPEPASVDLALFGHYPASLIKSGSLAGRSGADGLEPKVSLAFFSPTRRFCIIDGVFYAEHARLQDGGTIAKIEARRVLILRNGVKKWIPVTGRSKAADVSGA